MSPKPSEIYLEKRFYKPHLSRFVVIHCATYSNVPQLPWEMQSPSEKHSPSATLVASATPATLKSAARAEQDLMIPLMELKGPVMWAVYVGGGVVTWAVGRDAQEGRRGEEMRLGSTALIPIFPCSAFPWRLLASQGCIITAASGSVTALLNPVTRGSLLISLWAAAGNRQE